MIYLSFDEAGDFEAPEKSRSPLFIGGIIYDDKDVKRDCFNETKRIVAFMKRACEEVGGVFPRDLHVNKNATNSSLVGAVKESMGKHLSEFLNKGTFDNVELIENQNEDLSRKGRYHIVIMLRSSYIIESLQGEVSDLIKEGFASNLYLNMAASITSRVIFHNPVISDFSSIKVQLASRVSVVENGNSKRLAEYRRLGYREKILKDGNILFYLTDANYYRSVCVKEMERSNKKDIALRSFKVESIDYDRLSDDTSDESFLYLSDEICSYLSRRLGSHQFPKTPSDVWRLCDELTGGDNLIFFHDPVDYVYEEALLSYERADYLDVLDKIFDGGKCKGEYAKYYKTRWFPDLIEKIKSNITSDSLDSAVHGLVRLFHSNSFETDKFLYIYEQLREIAESSEERLSRKVMFNILDAGVAAYCHMGDPEKALLTYKECCEYADACDLDGLLMTRNRLVTLLDDSLRFDDALSIAEEGVRLQEELTRLKTKLLPQMEQRLNIPLGKTLSQMAQVCANLKDERATELFLKALSLLKDESPDYYITESYFLHYIMITGDKEGYLKYSKDYFGGNEGLYEQFKYILNEWLKGRRALIRFEFALYVYVKGIYTFRMDELDLKMLTVIKTLKNSILHETGLKDIEDQGHPWQLIYKYCAFIALAKGDPEVAGEFMKQGSKAVRESGPIIRAISYHGNAEYQMKCGNNGKAEEYTSKTIEVLKEMNVAGIPEGKDERVKYLTEKLTYMYD